MQDLIALLEPVLFEIITLLLGASGLGAAFRNWAKFKDAEGKLTIKEREAELQSEVHNQTMEKTMLEMIAQRDESNRQFAEQIKQLNAVLIATERAVAGSVEAITGINAQLLSQESLADARSAAVSALVATEHRETRQFIKDELRAFVDLAEQLKQTAATVPDGLRADFKLMAEDFMSRAYKLANGQEPEGKDAPPPPVPAPEAGDAGAGEASHG